MSKNDLLAVWRENYLRDIGEPTMGKSEFLAFTSAPKPLKPRTKREVALVAQAANEAFEDGLRKGRLQGESYGADRERTRCEKFLLDVVLAQARGASK